MSKSMLVPISTLLGALLCFSLLPGCASKAPMKSLEPQEILNDEDISGEGMWPWSKLVTLNEGRLKERGLKIPLADLWTKGEGGLLSAAVGLGGCSGSFVSETGLMLTNHHCVYGAVQRNSTEDKNLIKTGFIAMSQEEELPALGTKIFAFQSFQDVTGDVLGHIQNAGDDSQRAGLVEQKEKALISSCESAPNIYCQVFRYNDGLEFVLAKAIRILDLRLVAVPPGSLGEYGGEVDNFRWPRHTMDFSMLRAYVAPDGTPSPYSKDNVPYRPATHFAVNPKGISRGDLVMVVGTPYLTRRYLTSAAIKGLTDNYYKLRGTIFPQWIETLENTCKEIPESCIKTVGHIKTVNNGLTSTRGISAELNTGELYKKKIIQEQQWREWVAQDEERKKKYAQALDELNAFEIEDTRYIKKDLLQRYMTSTRFSHLLGYAVKIIKWAEEQTKPDSERSLGYQARDRVSFELMLTQKQGSIHKEADKRVLALLLSQLMKLPGDQQPTYLKTQLKGRYDQQSILNFLAPFYAGTTIDHADNRIEWMKASFEKLRGNLDPFIKMAFALKDETDAMHDRDQVRKGARLRLRPRYISSLIEMRGANFYPDANASPRVTFGTVVGYQKSTGWSEPFTAHSGLVNKATGRPPFDAPPPVLEQTDFGTYLHPETGELPICFLSSSDTTGGNSGSAAIDGSGRLVGINFDRVFENIAGDFGYAPSRSRNIMVDIRAILWYLDIVLGAEHLLKELKVTGESK